MRRSSVRVRSASLLIVVVAAAGAPAVVGAGEPPPAGPASLLEKVDATLGAQYVTLPQLPPAAEGDKTLAPYLYVAGGNPDTERLPLKKVSARAEIAGPIARVRVLQTFENNGQKPIEAIYVFPASTRA